MEVPGSIKEAIIEFNGNHTGTYRGEVNVWNVPGTTKVMDRNSPTGALTECTVETCPFGYTPQGSG